MEKTLNHLIEKGKKQKILFLLNKSFTKTQTHTHTFRTLLFSKRKFKLKKRYLIKILKI
jgi:hypothetical protein